MPRARRAVITGATKGIGKALAESLIAEGYDLAVCARNADDLQSMVDRFLTDYSQRTVLTRPTDVSSKTQLKLFADEIANSWDSVDVLINNAGMFIPGDVLQEPDNSLETTINTNLYSAYYLTRYLHPLILLGEQAHIFNMCSIASLMAHPGGGSYSISKFALRGFSMVLREELKQSGVKVTSIFPGATWSDSWKGADFPASRLMQATDIAEAVLSALRMSPSAVVEEIIIRPQLGDL